MCFLVEKVDSLGETCWNLSRAEGLGRCKKVDLGFVAPNTLCISQKNCPTVCTLAGNPHFFVAFDNQ